MGIDGGGSHTKAWLASENGNILGKGQSGASNYQSVGEQTAKKALHNAIQEAFTQAGYPFQKLDCLCLGLAGFGRDFEKCLIQDWAEKTGYARLVVVVNDADLLLWGATPDGWGLGLVSGTGSIAVGRTREGATARAGGWGYLIGDEGSGYSLGIAALRAAVQAADGRIPSTLLQADVLSTLGLGRIEELVAYLYQNNPSREAIAQLAGGVFSAAAQGDHQAKLILERAASELAKTALAVVSKLGWQGTIPCALGGGLFQYYPQLVQHLLVKIQKSGVELDPVQVATEPVAGAVRLAIHTLKSNNNEFHP